MNVWKILPTLVAISLVAVSCTSGADREKPTSETTPTGDPEVVSFSNVIDDSRTEYPQVELLPPGPEGEANPECKVPADGTLRVGGLLPTTGALEYLGPVQDAAIRLAQEDIEDAGGITGMEHTVSWKDSGDSGTALNSARLQIDDDVDVVIGPPSSTLSKQVTGEITGACRIHISAANTAVGFEELEQNELYFRTAPSDRLQGHALANLVAKSGPSNVAIIAASGDYGSRLAGLTAEALREGSIDSSITPYNPESVDFNTVTDQATRGNPDAYVLIGFAESSKILAELLRRSVEPDSIFLADGNAGNALGSNFTESKELDGIRGVQPGAEVTKSFKRRLNQENPKITDFTFGPETYDALIVVALAAELAQSDSPPEIAKRINGVTRDGTRCTTFTSCKNLIVGGETDIDYDGQSGQLMFDKNGEVTKASFATVVFG